MRFLIVYTLAVFGALGGAALGAAVIRPSPVPGPEGCGMWVLPGMFLGGAIGAALTSLVGLRLTRPAASPRPDQGEHGRADPADRGR